MRRVRAAVLAEPGLPPGAARQVVAGGLVVVVSLLGAGCHSPDPGVTPGQSLPSVSRPAPEPSPVPSQYHPVTAAKAAFQNYMDVQNAVGQDYYRGWDTKVIPLLTGPYADNRRKISDKYGEGQYYQVGEDRVLYMNVTRSDEIEVVMDVCVASSGVRVIAPDGTPVYEGGPEPYLNVVVVERLVPVDDQGNLIDGSDPFGQEWWRTSSAIEQEGATC